MNGRLAAVVALVALATGGLAKAEDEDDAHLRLCGACHQLPGVTRAPGPMQGPTLIAVVGRKAGGVAGFDYSDAMIEAGRNGLAWDPDTLGRFVADPQAVVPGTFMAAPVFRDDAEREAVLRRVFAGPRP